jgi:Cdc6-like AAA superfamily ATPase
MSPKILINLETLSKSFVPEKFLHREKELSELSNYLSNSINSFIYGSLGSGKTTLIKRVIENFNATKTGRAIYINCSLYQTTNAIFHEILLSLGSVVSSKSNYDLTKRLKSRIRHLDSKIIICLDHFQHLKELETVDRILNLGLTLTIVSDDRDAYRNLNPVSKASITNLIEIPGYTLDQTFEILLERVEQALEKYSYSEEKIKKIADMSKGNITLALNLLKSMALKAQHEGKDSIDDVDLGYEIDCPEGMLNRDKMIILKILKEWKSLPSSRLYDFYTEKAKYPKGRRSFRNYMRDLCAKGFVRNIGEKTGRVYEIVEQDEVLE